jgi:hypothetical protein
MKVCANCNPISELLTDADGKLYCRFHGYDYKLEEVPDPVLPLPDVISEVPEGTV